MNNHKQPRDQVAQAAAPVVVPAQQDRLLTVFDVEKLTGFKRTTIHKWCSTYRPFEFKGVPFPPKIKIEGSTRWSYLAVLRWIEATQGASHE